jgi:hypothetical protein
MVGHGIACARRRSLTRCLRRRGQRWAIGAAAAIGLCLAGPRETLGAAATSADALVLVNSQSARHLEFQHFIQPYLDNFGFPYRVQDIATNPPAETVTNYAVIIIGHSQIDTNGVYLTSLAQRHLSLAVSNGTGLVNFDSDLYSGSAGRYQFVQDVFGFTYGSGAAANSVSVPATETNSQMHWITALHPTNDAISFRSSIAMGGIIPPAGVPTLASAGSKPLLVAAKYGQGRAVQWGSYAWMVSSVLGPVDGLDDLVWRGVVWAARKPFVMRGMPHLVTMRIDDVEGPLWWVHMANEVGFKPFLAMFIGTTSQASAADLRDLVISGNATASVHSFNGSYMFYFDHQHLTNYSDLVQSNNFYSGTQWHLTNGIPISKVCATHYSEIGTNAFGGLKTWGMEFVPIEVVPGTVEYDPVNAPWLVGGPFRRYETPQPGRVDWPTYYADWLSVPGHPEFEGQFFNIYSELRDLSGCSNWCPDNDVAGSVDRATTMVKRALDSMVMATVFTHEWAIHPTSCCGGTTITTNNWRAIMQGITNGLASYQPSYVTLDYASQYVRATRTSRLVSASFDPASGQVTAAFSGKTDLDTVVYVFTGEDRAISSRLGTVPVFASSSNYLAVVTGPPLILAAPPSTTTNAGATVTLSVAASGALPLSYQWVRDGTSFLSNDGRISGAQGPTLTISNVLGGDSGSYTVVVTNASGSATSTPPAGLTVLDPVITRQPLSQTNLAGTVAVFEVTALGTSPEYQWLKDGATLEWASGATLSLTNVTFNDRAEYKVRVTTIYGTATSTAATLTVIYVPLAGSDQYTVPAGGVLTVPPPGVLANDSVGDASPLSAILLSEPLHGKLTLSSDGGFSYAPRASYVGPDSFGYSAATAQTNSAPATVNLLMTSATNLFWDDFTRLTDPGPLDPWRAQSGNWATAGGVLEGGTNTHLHYSFAYVPGEWTNCAIQGRFRFSSAAAWGGGLGGRLDPATGSHYAAWVYPDGSPGGSRTLKLIKFKDWTGYGYNGSTGVPMLQVSLPPVGTNWHTLQLAFHQNRIAVDYDGTRMMSVTDVEAQPWLVGGVSADMWTDATDYSMSVDDVMVRPLVVADEFDATDGAALTVPSPGVLGNDMPVYGTNLAARLVSGPTNGTLHLNEDGGFTYAPTNARAGVDQFTYQATDGPTNLGATVATITLTAPVTPVILAVRQTNDAVTITWTSLAGRTYRLQYRNSLFDPVWHDVAPDLTASAATTSATSLLGGMEQRLYRVILVQPVAPSFAITSFRVTNGVAAVSWESVFGQNYRLQYKTNSRDTNWQDVLPGVTAAGPITTGTNRISSVGGRYYRVALGQAVPPPPRIRSIRVTNHVAAVAWESVVGQAYRLQYKDLLTETGWHDVLPAVAAPGQTTTATNSVGSSLRRFYRVVLVP